MKKYLILLFVVLSALTASAQTSAKDSIAAAKLAAKAEKAQKAADLKAFKEKQKADLAAFIDKQNGVSSKNNEKPALTNGGDSVAYLLGAAQSKPLLQYVQNQLNVDTAYIDDFTKGILENIDNDKDPAKKAYAAGSNIASQIVQMAGQLSKDYYAADPDKSIDATILAKAIVAGINGNSGYRSEDANTEFQMKMEARQAANKEALYGPNRETGEKWLEENKKKDGVVTLPSGLQYKIITQGTGNKPTASDKVSVNYEGKLIDGTIFDSSYKRGKPTSFGVTQVIKGWTEVLQLMPVGSKYEVYIPYQLAYGDRETGKEIKPYSALIFTVELLDIELKDNTANDATVNKQTKNTKTSAKKK